MDAVGDDAGRLLNLMARYDPNAYSELAAFALALTRVAAADRGVIEEEHSLIRKILRDVSRLSDGEAELVVQLSRSMLGIRGADEEVRPAEQGGAVRRQQLMDALHAVAAVDGTVHPDEQAEIDRIAAELGLRPHPTPRAQ